MWRTKVLPVLMLTLHLLEARPQQDSLVTSMPTNSATTVPTTGSMAKPQVYSLNLRTDIRSRYARTLVTSRIANPADRAQEVTFQVTIPESAFVSKFIMEVDGTMMEGVVRERVQAKQEYHQAVQSGQTAGHVATASVRDSSHVRISVNVAPHSKASFNLTYEELLIRRKGRYELAINLNPGQLVREMAVDVYIQEATNITNLQVPAFRSTNEIDINESETVNDDAVVEWVSGRQAHVHFAPTLEAQRRLGASAGSEEKGLGGQFIVRYDVERENGAGEILALDGYFVHFFSPPELSPLPKHVIFVLDVSGSMHGRKIEQLREAMDVILRELRPVDYFNIIEFSYSVTVVDLESLSNSIVLSPETIPFGYPGMEEKDEPKAVAELPAQVKAFPANEEFITKARDAVRKMSAGGGTNINDAVRAALSVASKAVDYNNATDVKLPEPIIIFLTDGEATVGETRPDRILTQIEELNSVPIFSLAFGQDADLSFLKRLSLRAGAFARKIYEAADAALQLQDFYRQVASPLLANVKFTYLDSQVDGSSVTKQQFGLLFSGSELVVAGKLRDANTQELQLSGEVRGQGHDGITAFPLHTPIDDETAVLPLPGRPQMSATPSPQPGDRFLERLWAYLTIQQLLERYDAERQDDQRVVENGTTPSPAQNAKSKALELALKFSFVTPVTSLIVVKTLNGSQTTPSPSTVSSTTPAPLALQFAESQPLSGDRIAGGAAFGGGAFFAQAAYPASAAGFAGPPGFGSRPSYPMPVRAPAQPIAQEAISKIDSQDEANYTPRPVLSTTYRPTNRPPTTQSPVLFNLTRVNEESLTWLRTELNETSTPEWRTVRISNETETYKLLYSKQSTITGDLAPCTPPTLPPTDWKCRPLSDCVLAAFVDNADLFLSSFKCTVGIEGFLGTCCPELPKKQSDPQTEITEASEVTTQSSTDTSPQAA